MTGVASPNTKIKQCKDCLTEFRALFPGARMIPVSKARAAPYPGPRCRTHHTERKRNARITRHSRRLSTVYSITREAYLALKEYQGGRCAGCRRATGASKNLAVDHDHACCIGPTSCGKCVRGLVCSTCNDILAHFRDDPAAFRRMADYLEKWPSQAAGLTSGKEGIRRV